MRLLALADTQIGVPTVPLESQADVLRKIVQVALDRNVDAVIHGGDVFEGPVVTPEMLRTFIDATEQLAAQGIPMIVIRGNGRHDLATRTVHALDILREVDGFIVCDSPARIEVKGATICCLPWVHSGTLIAHTNGSLTHEEADITTAELLVRIARHLHEQCDPQLPTVLLAHWAISGSALPTGLPVDDMREPVLSWADLDAIGYDAILGGHVHVPQTISSFAAGDQTVGVVLGAPQHLNFGDSGDRGCWVVDFS